jgi:hypothetical protein
MDGKTLRNSHHGGRKLTVIHGVSALAVDNNLCPGQIATVEKSSGMTVIPELLSLVEIEGDIVSIDAMGCQKRIAKKIRAAGADCIPAVKGNQSLTEESINDTIRFAKPAGEDMDMDCGHGSIETHKCCTCTDFTCFENAGQWKDIHSIVKIEAERIIMRFSICLKQAANGVCCLTIFQKGNLFTIILT